MEDGRGSRTGFINTLLTIELLRSQDSPDKFATHAGTPLIIFKAVYDNLRQINLILKGFRLLQNIFMNELRIL